MLTFLIPTAKEMTLPTESFPQVISDKSATLVQEMVTLTVDELAKAYRIKPEAAHKELLRLEAIVSGSAPTYPALQLFNGLMYRNIKRQDLSTVEKSYLEQQVLITSSLYGVIPAFEKIAEHRLDFHTKINVQGQMLKAYWREDYDTSVANREQVISLLSSEFEDVFSKSIRDSFITVKFMEEKEGQLKTHSTISKKARGAFLTAAIEKQAETIQDLKQLTFAHFHYRDDLSSDKQLVYTKRV